MAGAQTGAQAGIDMLLSPHTPEYSLLSKMRSQVVECAGDHRAALTFFETAQALDAALGIRATATDIRRYVDLLDKALNDPDTPAHVRSRVQVRRDEAVARLIAIGPWTSARQLPATLLSLPGMVRLLVRCPVLVLCCVVLCLCCVLLCSVGVVL